MGRIWTAEHSMELLPPDFAPHPGHWGAEVVVMQPTSFEAVQEAVMALRDHATVCLLYTSPSPRDRG